jgi:hypothetical protein
VSLSTVIVAVIAQLLRRSKLLLPIFPMSKLRLGRALMPRSAALEVTRWRDAPAGDLRTWRST